MTAGRIDDGVWGIRTSLNPFLGEQGFFSRWPWAGRFTVLLNFDELLTACVSAEFLTYSFLPDFLADLGKIKTVRAGVPKTFLEMEVRFTFDQPLQFTGELEPTSERAAAALAWTDTAELSRLLHGARLRLEAKRVTWGNAFEQHYADLVEAGEHTAISGEAAELLRLVTEYDERVLRLARELSAAGS